MKGKIISKTGQEIKEIDLPNWFSDKVREDLAQKYFEISKKIQPYGPYYLAGKLYSASGVLRHMRHKWKTTYGHGISRVPRKIMWRRGDQFYWIGATVSSTRGGRRVHAPQPKHFMVEKKMNKKEIMSAVKSAFIATAKEEWIKKRYSSLKDKKLSIRLPIIISGDALKQKTKDFFKNILKALKELSEVAKQKRNVRAGKGKIRRGKYKKTAGMMLITGKNENAKISGIDIKKLNQVEANDLFPLGRLVVYTEEAIKELKDFGGKNV
jgi:large subunit ribosomal protein L4e